MGVGEMGVGEMAPIRNYTPRCNLKDPRNIRESVDSLCRDGADAQYIQYLSKSRITSPQTRKKLI